MTTPETNNTPAITWSWAIATYNRHDSLVRSCAHAMAQSLPPTELVITDASDNWEQGRDRVSELIDRAAAAGIPRPRMSYRKAAKASSAAQRNESVERSTADIVFVFDDDTMMYPDTAEKVIEVYARDTDLVVQAVTAVAVTSPPGEPAFTQETAPAVQPDSTSPTGRGVTMDRPPAVSLIRRLLRADERFVPYDAHSPTHPIPRSLDGLDVNVWKTAAGFNLTCRREAALREPFESRLEGYSPGEDSDMTYRLTRTGPIIARHDAVVCHLEAPGSRHGLFKRTALGAVNPLLLHRVHSTDMDASRSKNRAMLRRRLLIEALKDARNGDAMFPRAHGIAYALRHLDAIMDWDDKKLNQMFQFYQNAVWTIDMK